MKRELKSVVITPESLGFSGYHSDFSGIGDEAQAYCMVPLIYRAIQLRVNSLTRVPVYVKKGDTIISKGDRGDGFIFEKTQLTPIHNCSLQNLLALSEIALLLKGAAFNLTNQNEYGYLDKNQPLAWLNPLTMQSEMKVYNGVYQPVFYQLIGTQRFPKVGYWTIPDFLYFQEFNPWGVGPGVSATSVALADSRIIGSVTKFLGKHFTYDALPTLMVTSENMAPGEGDRVAQKIREKFREIMNNAMRVIGISGSGVKLERLTAEMKSFDFDKIDAHAVAGVSDAFGMPQSLLRSTSGANKAISDNERESYLNDTIIPRCNYFQTTINDFLNDYAEFQGEEPQQIEFAPEEMPEMQADEVDRASALKSLVDSRVPLMAALDILGYDLSDEAEAEIEASIEEQKNQPPPVVPPDNQQAQQPVDMQQAKADLDRWMRKSIGTFRGTKTACVDFASVFIPEDTRALVNEMLKVASTEQEIVDAFKIGSRHSAGDMATIAEAHDLAVKIQDKMKQLGHGEKKKPDMWQQRLVNP